MFWTDTTAPSSLTDRRLLEKRTPWRYTPVSNVTDCVRNRLKIFLSLYVRENFTIRTAEESFPGLQMTSLTTFTLWMKTWSSTLRCCRWIHGCLMFFFVLFNHLHVFLSYLFCSLQVSYFEIYMDKIRDLLDGEVLPFCPYLPMMHSNNLQILHLKKECITETRN